MSLFRVLLAFAILSEVAAAQGAANVLVVVNDNSSLSRTIGEYYARRREIPHANICRIRTSTDEEIPRAAYDREIATAVAQCLGQNGLAEQILYIATTSGVPLRISGTAGQTGDVASVDSELTLLYTDMKQRKPHPIAGMLPNPFFSQKDTKFSHPQFPIYLVTRLTAYDFAGVKGTIDRSMAAANRGKFVIDMRSGGDKDGNTWLLNAAIQLPADRVVLDQSSTVLTGVKDVIGYASWGSNDSNHKQRFLNFQWLPGAIATEYVSTDGRTFQQPPKDWKITDWNSPKTWFANSPQSMTGDFLLEGATGASGHVAEPYLMATPRPDVLLPAYFKGRNLAESYYLAIRFLSWQNVIVGDPLCSLGSPR